MVRINALSTHVHPYLCATIDSKEFSTVTDCYQTSLEFLSVKCRKVEADFSSGDIIGNGGIPLLSHVGSTRG